MASSKIDIGDLQKNLFSGAKAINLLSLSPGGKPIRRTESQHVAGQHADERVVQGVTTEKVTTSARKLSKGPVELPAHKRQNGDTEHSCATTSSPPKLDGRIDRNKLNSLLSKSTLGPSLSSPAKSPLASPLGSPSSLQAGPQFRLTLGLPKTLEKRLSAPSQLFQMTVTDDDVDGPITETTRSEVQENGNLLVSVCKTRVRRQSGVRPPSRIFLRRASVGDTARHSSSSDELDFDEINLNDGLIPGNSISTSSKSNGLKIDIDHDDDDVVDTNAEDDIDGATSTDKSATVADIGAVKINVRLASPRKSTTQMHFKSDVLDDVAVSMDKRLTATKSPSASGSNSVIGSNSIIGRSTPSEMEPGFGILKPNTRLEAAQKAATKVKIKSSVGDNLDNTNKLDGGGSPGLGRRLIDRFHKASPSPERKSTRVRTSDVAGRVGASGRSMTASSTLAASKVSGRPGSSNKSDGSSGSCTGIETRTSSVGDRRLLRERLGRR